MKQTFTLLLSLFMVLPVFSQYTVKGTVKDTAGRNLPGANVLLKDSYFAMPSGGNGEFSFSGVKEGSYSLFVSFVGYEAYEAEINVGADMVVEVPMQESSLMADEVIVSATRPTGKMPIAYTSIARENLEERNMGQDIPYMLKLSPSLVLSSDAGAGVGYTSFRIRGTDQNRINITLNGIPLNDAESHGTWFVNLPDLTSSLEQVEVQRGVGTSTTGAAAFGASLNLRSLDMRKDAYAEINSSAGSFNTFKNTILFGTGLINEKFTFDARFSKLDSDGFIDRASSDLISYSLSGAYYGKKDIVKLFHLSGKEKTYQAWAGVPEEMLKDNRTYNPYTYDNETDNYWQDHYQAFYSHDFGEGLLYNLALHYTRGYGYYEQYRADEDLADYGFGTPVIGDSTVSEMDLIRQKWLDNHFYGLTTSLSYKMERSEFVAGGGWNRYQGDHYGYIIWSEVAGVNDINRKWYLNDAVKTDWSLYAKYVHYTGNSLSLFTDLQLRGIDYKMQGADDNLRDISQDHDFLFFNPKAGARYRLNDNNEAYASFAIANREPNRGNYKDANPAGPEPVAETLYDYELGYNYHSGNFSVDINAYYMDYKDQLVLTGEINDVGSPIMTNVASSHRMGVELMAGYIFNSFLSWEGNATFSQNKIKDLSVFVDDWDTWGQIEEDLGESDISFSPSIIAASNIKIIPVENMQISLASKYVGKQYIDNTSADSRSLKPYFLNDIVAIYSIEPGFARELSFKLMLNNIFGEEYESNAWVYRYYYEREHNTMTAYYPQAGFNIMAGISLKF